MKPSTARRAGSQHASKHPVVRSIPSLPFKGSVDLADVIVTAREIQSETGYAGWKGTERRAVPKVAPATRASRPKTPVKKK